MVVGEPSLLVPAREAALRVLDAVDAACGPHRPGSELARVNDARGRTVHVTSMFLEILLAARRVAELTGGLVDPTRTGGWRAVRVDRQAHTVRMPGGVTLDLDGVARAFAADRAARAAAATGAGVLVALGDDIAMAGPAPDGGWQVRVPDRPGAASPGQDVTVVGGGLSTCGPPATPTRTLPNGVTVAHIGGPARRRPWRTVSVAAATCVDANAAAAAALARGVDAARWLTAVGLPARLVHADRWVLPVAGWPAEHTDVKVAG
ncbi:FAD:protein FMN transferase [Actinomadura sp. NPDC047616]|uniref:FAD:protein FMN transferase n=1 Tax=Actinomadura sp. NPDC047616 TaxID=3155914 RepID=UPI0033D22C77